jgi:hypothetical protein
VIKFARHIRRLGAYTFDVAIFGYRGKDLQFLLSLIVLAVTVLVEIPPAFCDDQIEWEVKQPFRFLNTVRTLKFIDGRLNFSKHRNLTLSLLSWT